MLLIALESNNSHIVQHAAAYLRETYGFITLTRGDLTAVVKDPAAGLEAYIAAFTASRKRKVTSHEDARNVGRLLRYKPNSKGRPTAVPLGFEYFEDHAGIIVFDTRDDSIFRKVRENEGALWYVHDGDTITYPLSILRTGDKLILHNSAIPERLNTALSMALGGESIVNTIDETPAAPVAGSIASAVMEAANEMS